KKSKARNDFGNEVMNVKLRYKKPDGDSSKLLEYPLMDNAIVLNRTSDNFRFAAAVAEFGMLLRNSEYKGKGNFEMVAQLAKQALGDDAEGYRKEFVQMVQHASLLKEKKETAKSE
ncbi:MAG: YfbK domain-containing protein, partial [Panacibacter sp.]